MQAYQDNISAKVNGVLTPILGVQITVTDKSTGKPAALYSDNGVTLIAQPLTTDETGYFGFYAANGHYTLSFSSPQIKLGPRVVQLYDPADDAPFTQQQAAAPSGASKLGYGQRTVENKLGDVVNVKDKGAKGDGVTDDTAAILAAVASLRNNQVTILNDIGGTNITAYSSGVVEFGPGVFVVSPDTLQFTQDLGLTLRGRGSRRTNNAVRAATTLLIKGASSGFGIQFHDNGARGATIMDMDICYADATFTGDIIDTLNCPGLTLERAFVGTFGLTGATRIQSARSLLRTTYDEYLTLRNCVFDGAVDGWWSDDVRSQNGNSFGGSNTKIDSCVFYDFTGRAIRHDGNRTRQGIQIHNTVINPISVNCQRGIDLTNIDGIDISGGGFTPSTTFHAATEWMLLGNATGSVRGVCFDDLSKAGTLDGMLDVRGNRVYSLDGFTLTGGVITGASNEFGKCATGWTLSPAYQLTANLGPDLFKAAVTNSYSIPADSVSLSGKINYDASNDQSASKFTNVSGRIRIVGVDEKLYTASSATFSVPITDTGRTVQASGSVDQTITLPAAVPGTRLAVNKASSTNLTINMSGSNKFYTGSGPVKSTATAAAADVGGTLTLEAYATVGWRVVTQTGTWTYA